MELYTLPPGIPDVETWFTMTQGVIIAMIALYGVVLLAAVITGIAVTVSMLRKKKPTETPS